MSELKIIGWDVISFFIIDAINVLLPSNWQNSLDNMLIALLLPY